MQHETKMENQSWLKKLARRLGPGHVVNLCFIVVLLFSTLLTWREVVVLEDAYISSQRNHLENVANALDKHLQYNVDKLIFLRNGMREALVAPLDFTSLRNAVTEFEQHRDEHAWQILRSLAGSPENRARFYCRNSLPDEWFFRHHLRST